MRDGEVEGETGCEENATERVGRTRQGRARGMVGRREGCVEMKGAKGWGDMAPWRGAEARKGMGRGYEKEGRRE